jgi:hypothetical protein
MESLPHAVSQDFQASVRKTAGIARPMARTFPHWILLGSLLLLGQLRVSGQIGGATTIGPPRTTSGPHWWDFVYSPAFPPEARRALVPLYQRMDDISQQLAIGARMNAQELADAILGALGGAAESRAGGVVRQSATGRPPGSSSPPDAPPDLEDLGTLILDLRSTGLRISEIRRQYNVETTIGPASKPLDTRSLFQPDPSQIKKWIAEVQSGASISGSTVPGTDKPPGSTTGQTFNVNALTPAEQAARQRNEQIVANETLRRSSPGSTELRTDKHPSTIEGSWTVADSSNSCGSGGPGSYNILRQGADTFVFAHDRRAPIVGAGPGKYALHFRQAETSTDDGWAMDMAFTLVDSDTLQMDGQAQILVSQADNQPGPCILHFILRRAK